MKLPNDCPFSEISLESRVTEMYLPNCCRAGANGYLIGTDDPPLCRARQTELEVYRFIWRSSSGEALVHISNNCDTVGLRSHLFHSRLRLRVPSPSLVLTPDDWEKLQCAFRASDFWSLDARDEQLGLDGTWWLIEGRRGDIYHSVNRWSPRGAVRDLGRLFFALAGSPLADVRLYVLSVTSRPPSNQT